MNKNNQPLKRTYEKPLVTFALFAYNQEKYIEDACRAALSQTYSPLEIFFSDDSSSDRTFELMEEIARNYNGPHKIILNRNQQNFGLISHINQIFRISSGDLIVAAAGDDISLPDRVQCLVSAFNRTGKKALLIHSSATKINDSNLELGVFIPPVIDRPMNSAELVDSLSLYIGATGAWNPALYKEFGPIAFKNAYEDLVLGFRAVIKNSLVYVDKPLVRYRIGSGISTKLRPSIMNFSSRIAIRRKDIKVALDVYEQRLRDLDCIRQWDRDATMKHRLIRNINFQKMRFIFYRNPFLLLLQMFSKDPVLIFRLCGSEVKYLLGFTN